MNGDARRRDRATPLSGVETIVVAGFFGLLTGVMEGIIRTLQRYLLGFRMWVSPDIVWMAPVVDVALFLLLGLALVGLGRKWPAFRSPGVVVTLCVFVALIGPLLSYQRFHVLASLALAVGVAVQAGRMAPGPRRLAKLATRGAWTLGAVVLIAAGVLRGGQWLDERRALSELPPGEEGAPNVLLIILDTVRAASLSAYGYPLPTTPTLEAEAERGVVFEHAWSTSAWTLPAHASIFTGRYPNELSTGWKMPLDDTHPTLAERFASHGYSTAGFVANLMYTTRDGGLQRGFAHYEDYPVSVSMAVANSWLARLIASKLRPWLGNDQKLVRKHARSVNRDFLRWLDGQGERPFFVFLNFMDAHAPYLPADSFSGRFGPAREGRAMHDLSTHRDWSAAEIDSERAAYDGSIAWLDAQLGHLFEELGTRGVLDNTILVITSDHGEQFGEHGLMDHGNSLYRPLLEVPLLVVWPGRLPAGVRVDTPVSLRDVPATITDLAFGRAELPGRSLAPLWAGGDVVPSPVLAELQQGIRSPAWLPVSRGDMQSLVVGGHHYIRNGDGREELYDLSVDPQERRDLAGSDAARLAATRAQLEALIGPVGSSPPEARTPDGGSAGE